LEMCLYAIQNIIKAERLKRFRQKNIYDIVEKLI